MKMLNVALWLRQTRTFPPKKSSPCVIPAQAGIQKMASRKLDSCFRRNDRYGAFSFLYCLSSLRGADAPRILPFALKLFGKKFNQNLLKLFQSLKAFSKGLIMMSGFSAIIEISALKRQKWGFIPTWRAVKGRFFLLTPMDECREYLLLQGFPLIKGG